MNDAIDVRTLCDSCRAEYEYAGYNLRLLWAKNKEPCDRCRVNLGWAYELQEHFCSSDGESEVSYQFLGREFESHQK